MNILITAGGTTEKIDDIRKITNSGTGKLGATVADCFSNCDAVKKIYYVCSEKAIKPESPKTEILIADDTLTLEKVIIELCSTTEIDVVVHSMAVSDYRVRNVSTAELIADNIIGISCGNFKKKHLLEAIIEAPSVVSTSSDSDSSEITSSESNPSGKNQVGSASSGKISSENANLAIIMEKTPKIISLFRNYLPNALIFGFKLLVNVTENHLIDVAHELLTKNDCNYVVANDLKAIGQDNHLAYIIDRNKEYDTFKGKEKIADAICNIAIRDLK